MQVAKLISRVSRPLRQAALYLSVIPLCCGVLDAQAGSIPFPAENVSYDLHGEQLRDFLKRFFNDVGIAVTLSDLVQAEAGSLNGPRSGNASAVFKSIVSSNGLVAYYDGASAYIYESRELGDRFFRIEPERMDAFRAAAVDAGLPDTNDTVKIKAGMVTAHGTPRFLDQLSQLYTAFSMRQGSAARAAREPRDRAIPGGTTLHFISLKYAWAADTTFSIGNNKTIIPGVATILRQVLGQPDPGRFPSTSTASSGGAAQSGQGLRGRGLAALSDRIARSGGPPPIVETASSPGQIDGQGQGQGQGGHQDGHTLATYGGLLDSGPGPRIVADPYRNALIIRDTADRMPIYDEIVHQLDVESQIIQLDATVIDIDRTKITQLGVDWSYQNGKTSVATSTGAANIAGGLQVNSIVGNVAQFAANIRALEQNGVTNIVQRPQVVTLNDTEAVIQSTQTVYVPVAGAYDEDLYNVQAGTTLRVTPHIIVDNGRERIRLLVTIEDGSLNVTAQPATTANGQTMTQSMPTVVNNAVNTQAIIDVGEGLLLGGLVRRERSTTTQKVPVLGSIPLVGRLFRTDSVNKSDTERLFLISPKIIVASASRGTSAPVVSPTP